MEYKILNFAHTFIKTGAEKTLWLRSRRLGMAKEVWEVGKTYKIAMKDGQFFTATIIAQDKISLRFIDKFGTPRGIAKDEVKDWREVRSDGKTDP